MKNARTVRMTGFVASLLMLLLASTANADVIRATGEQCPNGYGHVTYQQASANPNAYCSVLEEWDIARLADGGSMDGRGYQCKVRQADERSLGNSLCESQPAAVNTPSTSLNQAAYVPGSTQYKFGYNSIPNMPVVGAPADTDFNRMAMLHDGSAYRLYFFKKGSPDTFYQFAFNSSTNRYEYGFNSIKELKVVGMPADANTKSFAMLHDGKDYRLYMRSQNGMKLYQAAYKTGSDQYIYGHNSIPAMDIVKAPADITNNQRWAMLHDGQAYRLYIGSKGNTNQFHQFAFNPATSSYEYAFNNSIPVLTLVGAPANSEVRSFSMLHDGADYRYYYHTK